SPVAAAEPRDDRTPAEDGICPGQFTPARSCARRQNRTAQDGSRSGTHHCPNMGTRNGGCFPFPIHSPSHQLLRALWRRKELSRQSNAHTTFATAQQAHPTWAGGSGETGTLDRTTSWPGSMKPKSRKGIPIERPCRSSEDGRVSSGRGSRSSG